ncbi:MAG: helix-turn-helix transcriptional regulator [Deltaproteobacteria bacterium]|nr:helix-turn-helix transcriptional regulator [Deltaproteobacteria bacterium]
MQKQTENLQEVTRLQTISTKPRSPSIRKLYLNKRANVLRESFEQNNHNIQDFVKDVESSSFNATRDELLFAQCLNWMQENLYRDANIADLAKEIGVSVRKIQRLFSFFLQRTYTSVLLDMRIESAKAYLAQHKNSVGEVAYMVGIKDHAYFTYLFRKATEMTPTEYRLSLIQQQYEE